MAHGNLSFPLLLIILCCSTLIKHTSQAWFVCSVPKRKGSSCVGRSVRSIIAPCTSRRALVLAQSSDDDNDGIDSRWKDVLEKLGDSSAVGPEIPPLQSLQDLESSIKSQGYKKTPISREFKDKNYVQSSDFALNSDSLTQLENILGEQLYSDMDDDDEEDLAANDSRNVASWTTDEDALFLDAESYLAYSSGDGGPEDFVNANYNFDSARTGAIPPSMSLGKNFVEFAMPPDAPYFSNNVNSNDKYDSKNGSNQEVTLADILALQQTMAQRRPPSPEEEKAIFEQVFQGEQAYFEKTSTIFREGLTNKTAAQTATFMRRNKQYRKNLLRELNKLEKQIQDFEVLLENEAGIDRHLQQSKDDVKKEHSGTTTTIERTNTGSQFRGKSEKAEVLLGEHDDNTELGMASTVIDDPIEEWVLVEDPSTGKAFFWNSKTDEMKVSLDEQNDS